MPRLRALAAIPDQRPIPYVELHQARQAAYAAEAAARRAYRVSDRHVLFVQPNWSPAAAVVVTIETEDGIHRDIGHLAPAALVKCAEIKSMVDDWISGKLEFLPPSTFTPKPDDEA